jgi:hypothetical protein
MKKLEHQEEERQKLQNIHNRGSSYAGTYSYTQKTRSLSELLDNLEVILQELRDKNNTDSGRFGI